MGLESREPRHDEEHLGNLGGGGQFYFREQGTKIPTGRASYLVSFLNVEYE